MSISKISRGLVVFVFACSILALMYLNIYSIVAGREVEFGSIYLKLLYIISIILIIFAYSVIKEKLSKKKFSKRKNAVIRYTFIILLAFLIKVLIGIYTDPKQIFINAIIYAVFSLVNAIMLKKIIYNISKSYVLSTLGMMMYIFLPNVSSSVKTSIITYSLILAILFVIMFMQKIIDELKQIGIKNKKYIILSLVCGIFIAATMFLGVNSLIWIITLIVVLFCTSNLDRTHVNFSNKFINMLRQKSKELLYRFERIYINKVFIVLFVISVEVLLLYYGGNFLIYNVIKSESIINVITNIRTVTNNVGESFNLITSIDTSYFINNLETLVCNTKLYTIILTIYIIFIEILNVALRRKYDTKSTIIKTMFILLIAGYGIFGLDYICYTQILQTFLVLISIINTTNLYLNRDERIKLLNA